MINGTAKKFKTTPSSSQTKTAASTAQKNHQYCMFWDTRTNALMPSEENKKASKIPADKTAVIMPNRFFRIISNARFFIQRLLTLIFIAVVPFYRKNARKGGVENK